MDKEIKGILIEYEDGNSRRIERGCCVDLSITGNELHVDMLNAKPTDIVRLAYGLLCAVDRLGMMDLFQAMIVGEITKEKG